MGEYEQHQVKILLDRAPTENGPEFDEWCAKYDFTPLNGDRRAWCSSMGSYFRNAIGVGCTRSGEIFLVYEQDLSIID